MQLDYAIEGYWLAKRRDFSATSNCPSFNPAAGQVVQVRSVYADSSAPAPASRSWTTA
jgi:hypothetical protein